MSTDLVLSRGCRHSDWWALPQTSVEFCRSCGFSLIYALGQPPKDVYAEVQAQPRPQDTFDPARSPPPVARSHQYRPLDLTQGRQIRVLVLKAGRPQDPLQCELEHVSLQQGPIYEALSYTWADEKGDDSICRGIQCGQDGQLIGITKNCELALLRLRKQDVDRLLWVDAVCIDQSNILERNHQVKNMIAIFRSAIRVVVYLGEGSLILDRLVDYMSNDTGGQLPQVSDFISLFQSRWFHRVWVLQEVAVAKSILVMYGIKQMSWADLIAHGNLFLRLMAARNLSLVLPPVIFYGLRQTEAGDRRLRGVHYPWSLPLSTKADLLQGSDLLSLLQVSRNCSCKDARDKVYSILGLLQDEPALSLQADYSPSTTAGWVFLQVAAWHVDTTKTLGILSQVDGTSALDMPSWVPDWTRKSPTALPPQFKEPQEFFAPRITVLDNQTLLSTANLGYPLGCVLEVTGRRYGTVWTDRKIFGKALVPSGIPSRATDHNESDPHVADPSPIRGNIHWLLNPSQNPGTRHCDGRLDFWGRILSLYHGAIPSGDFKTGDVPFRADIPPAFGGFCSNCFEKDRMHWQIIKEVFNQTMELANKKITCCCMSQSPSPGHFDKDQLDKFIANMSQYGMGRRLFGTDHSLGLGPMELEDWDEVWTLEGATVPFILRPVGNHYRLVGACYIHQASQTTDRCSICSHESVRKRTTLSAPTQPAATQTATRTTTSTSSSMRTRLSREINSNPPDPAELLTLFEERETGRFSAPLSPPPVERRNIPVMSTVFPGSLAEIKIR